MSYEMPIKLAMGMERVMVQAREEQDKKIYQAVLDSGINVSREELIKALNYDRDQYVKGYEAGKAEMQWIPCSERLPKGFGLYLTSSRVYCDKGSVEILYFDPKEEFDVEFWAEKIDAWMPLPPAFVEGVKE